MEKSGEQKKNFIKWFSEINNKDILIVGGKGASLGEMYNNKFPIPPGFVVTSEAYKYYIDESGFSVDSPRTHSYSQKGKRCYGKHDWRAKRGINSSGV